MSPSLRFPAALAAIVVVTVAVTLTLSRGGDDGRVTTPTVITPVPAASASPLVVDAPEVDPTADAPKQARAHRPKLRPGPARVELPPGPASEALGLPFNGKLVNGIPLPEQGADFFSYDLPTGQRPDPAYRRYGTRTLVRWLQQVLAAFRARHPEAPRIGIADLSLPQGGVFGGRWGGQGHNSHQNGLDVDVLYPRIDRVEAAARTPAEVDRPLAQALVDAFVASGAQFCFVGQSLGLTGPPQIVQAIPNHDDHVHVRIAVAG